MFAPSTPAASCLGPLQKSKHSSYFPHQGDKTPNTEICPTPHARPATSYQDRIAIVFPEIGNIVRAAPGEIGEPRWPRTREYPIIALQGLSGAYLAHSIFDRVVSCCPPDGLNPRIPPIPRLSHLEERCRRQCDVRIINPSSREIIIPYRRRSANTRHQEIRTPLET